MEEEWISRVETEAGGGVAGKGLGGEEARETGWDVR